jgi:DNA repair exonuclease SbcCD ATPase subunit
MTPELIAAARLKLEEAEQRQQEAASKVSKIEQRLAEYRNRQNDITAARLDGTAPADSASEFAALAADIAALEKMHATAQAEALLLSPTKERDQLAELERQMRHAQDQEIYTALSAKVSEIEALLCRAIGAAHQAGRKLGHHSLSQTWRPSNTLIRAFSHGVAPEV